jgi:hypothetical protein
MIDGGIMLHKTIFLLSVTIAALSGAASGRAAEVDPRLSANAISVAPTVVAAPASGLCGSTVLIVRHAEKPDEGVGLTPAGEARAAAYARYFQSFPFKGAMLHVDTLVAAADTGHSERPRLTLAPLSQAIAIPVQQPSASEDVGGLANWLRAGPAKRTILVSWHHSKIGRLVGALGADPRQFLFLGRWPPSVYNWVVVLHFDADGNFVPSSSGLVKEDGTLAS